MCMQVLSRNETLERHCSSLNTSEKFIRTHTQLEIYATVRGSKFWRHLTTATNSVRRTMAALWLSCQWRYWRCCGNRLKLRRCRVLAMHELNGKSATRVQLFTCRLTDWLRSQSINYTLSQRLDKLIINPRVCIVFSIILSTAVYKNRYRP